MRHCTKSSPPQLRRGGAPKLINRCAGVVLVKMIELVEQHHPSLACARLSPPQLRRGAWKLPLFALLLIMTSCVFLEAQTPVDLSGNWAPDPNRGGIGQSLSLSDIRGQKRGQEEDIPYQPWAREKTLSEKPSTGPDSDFGGTTDPQVLYCEPPGVPHIYLW